MEAQTVEEWLGPGLFKAIGPYLMDDLGVEEVDDLRMLEDQHLETIRKMLKPMPLKKFDIKHAELMRPIPEGVAERPDSTSLETHHAGEVTVRGIHSGIRPEDTSLPGVGAQGGISLDGLTIKDFLAAFSIFGSMRFPVPAEARALFQALKDAGVHLKIVDMKAGQDIDKEVYEWIEHCDTFLVFGTKTYGEDTGNSACTYNELKFAQAKKKRIILLRMISWEDEFEELQARVLFNRNILMLEWQQGQSMPEKLVPEIIKALELPAEGPRGATPVHVAAANAMAEAKAAKAQAQAEVAKAQADAEELRAMAAQEAEQMKIDIGAALAREMSALEKQQAKVLADQKEAARLRAEAAALANAAPQPQSRLIAAAKAAAAESLQRFNATPQETQLLRSKRFGEVCRTGDLQSMRGILRDGIDINATSRLRDASGQEWDDTPLGWCVDGRQLEAARFLLDHGADTNKLSGYGSTPLHLAAQQGHLPMVQLLVDRGASISLKSRNGKDAIDWTRGGIHHMYDGVAGSQTQTAMWLTEHQQRAAQMNSGMARPAVSVATLGDFDGRYEKAASSVNPRAVVVVNNGRWGFEGSRAECIIEYDERAGQFKTNDWFADTSSMPACVVWTKRGTTGGGEDGERLVWTRL